MTEDVNTAIAALTDWRGERLAHIRKLILAADPTITEDVKWRKASNPLGVPTWSLDGILCTGESYKDKIKLTFFKGASLSDPAGLFNAADTGGTRRAIDIRESDRLDDAALVALVKNAVAANLSEPKRKAA